MHADAASRAPVDKDLGEQFGALISEQMLNGPRSLARRQHDLDEVPAWSDLQALSNLRTPFSSNWSDRPAGQPNRYPRILRPEELIFGERGSSVVHATRFSQGGAGRAGRRALPHAMGDDTGSGCAETAGPGRSALPSSPWSSV